MCQTILLDWGYVGVHCNVRFSSGPLSCEPATGHIKKPFLDSNLEAKCVVRGEKNARYGVIDGFQVAVLQLGKNTAGVAFCKLFYTRKSH